MNIILQDISFIYARAKGMALEKINLEIPKGEKLLIMGRTGAGKSTLCFCIKGLIPKVIPGKLMGKIFYDGIENLQPNPYIGLVLQEFEAQIFNSTVELEIAFGLQNLGIERNKIVHLVKESIKKLSLSNYEKMAPFFLSGGQKQRLAIASIWAMNPDVFILDEPMTDLDTEGRTSVFQMIQELNNEYKSTLLVDNELDNALVFNKVLIMDKGKIIKESDPASIILNSEQYSIYGIKPPTRINMFNELKLNKEKALTFQGAIKEIKKSFPSLQASLPFQQNTLDANKPLIILDNVFFEYPNTSKGVFRINTIINKGDFIGLIGKNGSGKSTLLKLIAGILTPNRGKIFIKDKQPHKIIPSELPKTIGFVFQNPDYQIFASSIKEELAYCMKLANQNPSTYEKKIKEVLKIVHLEGYEDEDPFLLTKGDRQKVAIATALINEPDILILDEPTTGLDYQEQLSILKMLQKLNENGKTVIISTHSLWIIEEFVKRCIVMSEGFIILDEIVEKALSETDKITSAGLKLPELALICKELNLPFRRKNDLIKLLRSSFRTSI